MALIDLWKSSRAELQEKRIDQIIAISGDVKLRDSDGPDSELRQFLRNIPSSKLKDYSSQCLTGSFSDSGLALQDIVNEVGGRLGLEVTPGRCRGVKNDIGFDGIWRFPSGHAVVVEVKTTDAYRIDLGKVAGYRTALIDRGEIDKESSSMLIVVGRQDTGDLEAQIRGSRHAWDVRLISCDALLRLMHVKEDLDDPAILQQMHDILIPHEFTRLDKIVEIIFTTTEDVKKEIESESDEAENEDGSTNEIVPVAFHQECVQRLERVWDISLIKRTRTGYSTSDNSTAIACAVSRAYTKKTYTGYWFAFHPSQLAFLKQIEKSYMVFGCGSSENTIAIPINELESWLDQMNQTVRGERHYWHIHIHQLENKFWLLLKKGVENIDLSSFVVTN